MTSCGIKQKSIYYFYHQSVSHIIPKMNSLERSLFSATVDYSAIKDSTTLLDDINEKAFQTKKLTAEAIQKIAENKGVDVAACFMTYQRTQERAYTEIQTIINKAAGLKAKAYLLANKMRCSYIARKSTSFFFRLKMELMANRIESLQMHVDTLRAQGYECGQVIDVIHSNTFTQMERAAEITTNPEPSKQPC